MSSNASPKIYSLICLFILFAVSCVPEKDNQEPGKDNIPVES
jgi:PBP1b-binding outer membrane lipoprotein LpoB|tara:strand:+ start:1750 stop:1875 length:126 start_codon:yes stop_codon:yes gene_type:complete